MNRTGVNSYKSVAVDSGVRSSDPHQLVLMLYDGALEAIAQGQSHLKNKRVPEKCAAIGKALRVVDEGLKASLDRKVGGAIAEQLFSLYEYITLRLLQGNLRNDERALEEARTLLADLRSAWAQIGAQRPGSDASLATTASTSGATAPRTAAPVAGANPATRLYQDTRSEGLPRVAASA